MEDALPLEQVLQAEGPASLLLGVDAYFADRPVLILKPPAEKKVRNGMSLFLPETPDGEYRVYGAAGDLPSPEPDGAGKADHHQELLPGVSARKSAERKRRRLIRL